MKKVGLLFVLISIVVSGCDYLPTLENKAKKAVASRLIDPDSAKFEFVAKGKKEGDYCGFVNGKNRMGGYAGASPFTYQGESGEVTMISKIPTDSDFKSYCRIRDNDAFPELMSGCEFPVHYENICGVKLNVNESKFCKHLVKLNLSALWKEMKEELQCFE